MGSVHHRRLGRDASVLGDAEELGDHQAGAQTCGRLQVRSGGDHHAIGNGEFPDSERREHRWRAQPHRAVWRPRCRSREPGIHATDQFGVALRQVDVGDPAAAGQQVEGELP